MVDEIAQIFRCYPKVKTLYQTADGWVHLKKEDADGQAKHLTNPSIKSIRRSDVPALPADANQ